MKKIIVVTFFCVVLFSNHTMHCMKSLVEVIASEPYWRCVKYGDPDPRDKDFETVKKLLEDGADVDELGVEGYYENKTPLTAAIFNEHGKTAELLLNHGADINKKGYNRHETPLHMSLCCCPNINLFVMTLLLERNARIDFNRNGDRHNETDIEIIESHCTLKEDFAALFNTLETHESSWRKNKSKITFNEFCSIIKDCLKYKRDKIRSWGGYLFGKKIVPTKITISEDIISTDWINWHKKLDPDKSDSEIIQGIIQDILDDDQEYRTRVAGTSKEYIYIRILVARMLFALTSKKEFKLFKKCLNKKLDTEFLTTNLPDYPFLYERDQKIHKQVSIHLLKHFLDHGIITWNNDILSVLPSKRLRDKLYSDYMPTRIYESAISMNLKPDINFIFLCLF